MDIGEIEQRLRTRLREEFESDRDLIKPDAVILSDLGLDSLDIVDLAVLIDRLFGVKLTREEMVSANTFGKLVSIISSKT